MALHWMAQTCVVLMALHHMAHILFWWWRWWLFIRRRKAFLGVGGALSDGTHFCLALMTLLSVMATKQPDVPIILNEHAVSLVSY